VLKYIVRKGLVYQKKLTVFTHPYVAVNLSFLFEEHKLENF